MSDNPISTLYRKMCPPTSLHILKRLGRVVVKGGADLGRGRPDYLSRHLPVLAKQSELAI